jgi:DNA-binding response OmpR family regulator
VQAGRLFIPFESTANVRRTASKHSIAWIDNSIDLALLALLDLVMPQPTGFEICQAMKSRAGTRLVSVVLVTGLDSDDDRIHGIQCDADDFLNKPTNNRELRIAFRNIPSRWAKN